jgi:hypothetical protein
MFLRGLDSQLRQTGAAILIQFTMSLWRRNYLHSGEKVIKILGSPPDASDQE